MNALARLARRLNPLRALERRLIAEVRSANAAIPQRGDLGLQVSEALLRREQALQARIQALQDEEALLKRGDRGTGGCQQLGLAGNGGLQVASQCNLSPVTGDGQVLGVAGVDLVAVHVDPPCGRGTGTVGEAPGVPGSAPGASTGGTS